MFLYMLYITIPRIIFCILLFRVAKKLLFYIPKWCIPIIYIITGIIILRIIVWIPLLFIIPVVFDNNSEFLKSNLMILLQYGGYAIITICYYSITHIIIYFLKRKHKQKTYNLPIRK